MKTLEQRLLDRVTEDSRVSSRHVNTPCWRCNYASNGHGYRQIKIDGRKWLVHRLAFWLWVGELIEDLFVNHHCDNRWCVNPDHLFLGTHQDGVDDKCNKLRQARGDGHSACIGEVVPRGDEHWTRINSEKLPRGDAHFARANPEKLARGIAHGNAKLTEEDVRWIRMWVAEGFTQQKIADEFGVSQTRVGFIARRESWEHVK